MFQINDLLLLLRAQRARAAGLLLRAHVLLRGLLPQLDELRLHLRLAYALV